MGYDTYYNGCLDLNKEPNEDVKKLFEERPSGGYRDDGYDLWRLCHDLEDGTNWFLELDIETRNYKLDEELKDMIDKVFIPNGLVLDGSIEWQGDSSDDMGRVVVTNNKIKVFFGHTIYVDSDSNVDTCDAEYLGELGFFKKGNNTNDSLGTEVK